MKFRPKPSFPSRWARKPGGLIVAIVASAWGVMCLGPGVPVSLAATDRDGWIASQPGDRLPDQQKLQRLRPPPSTQRSLPRPPSDPHRPQQELPKRLSPEERERLNERFQQWRSMPPEHREDLRRRFEQWRNLPSQERDLYRRRFEQWRRLSPEEQRLYRQKLTDPERLSPQEREEIRRRFLGR